MAKGVVGSKRRACIKGAASAVDGMEGDMAAWLSQVQAVVAMEGLSDDSSNNGSDTSKSAGVRLYIVPPTLAQNVRTQIGHRRTLHGPRGVVGVQMV